ncbi:MAG: hypothetical protein E7277_08135 [Lachnospiraceae bacterium]|nr:hypothetical protein [Lachnospiraceae bacterium]
MRSRRKVLAGLLMAALLLTGVTMPAKAETSGCPESFNWRDLGMVTPVKSQSPYNACWAFSAVACMEQNILINGGGVQDLSESQLGYSIFTNSQNPLPGLEGDRVVYNQNEKPWYAYGGNNVFTMNLLVRGIGPVMEERAPYTMITQGVADDVAFGSRDYEVTGIYAYAGNDHAGIKNAIMEYGGVTMAVHMENNSAELGDGFSGYISSKAIAEAKKDKKEIKEDHEVCVVGWDDHYSRENFGKDKPEEDGAWLCKNSYGTSWGDDGYYWLSYEDAIANDSSVTCYAFEVEEAEGAQNIYQYDGGGSIDSLSVLGAANIFTARKTEKITAVRVRNMSNNAQAVIQIFTGVEDGKPESGVLAMTKEVTISKAGYVTVTLEEPVRVVQGQQFSVCVLYPQKGSIGIDRDVTYTTVNMAFDISANPGESFCKLSPEKGWNDLNGEGKEERSLRIKAITESFDLETPENLSVSQKNGVVALRWNKVKDATGYRIYRRTNAGKYVLIATVGNVKTYKDRSVKRGGTYYYKIKAEAGDLQSAFSTYKKVKIS